MERGEGKWPKMREWGKKETERDKDLPPTTAYKIFTFIDKQRKISLIMEKEVSQCYRE